MENNKMLPIGSVVILKKGHHRLMIIGYLPQGTEGEKKIYDYFGCFYPEGFYDPKQSLVFNNDMIAKVFSEGYSDDEEKSYRVKINKISNDIRDANGHLKLSEEELGKYVLNILRGGK